MNTLYAVQFNSTVKYLEKSEFNSEECGFFFSFSFSEFGVNDETF